MITESRPFKTPAAGSVVAELGPISPESDANQLSEFWNPGDDVVIRATARLADHFWDETGISPHEDVALVVVASCMSSRTRWRAQTSFTEVSGVWQATVELTADGSDLSVELTADLWVVGPGRTTSSDPENAIHQGAKLWQLPSPMSLRLDRDESSFPTSAVSFGATGRRSVAWAFEVAADAEPHWSISSSVRLFVNIDLSSCDQIVNGDAPDDIYRTIECDIQLGVLHFLGGWRDAVPVDRMQNIANEDLGSVAALGLSIASSLGLTLDEGCRLAIEDPLSLGARSRESLDFYRRAVG